MTLPQFHHFFPISTWPTLQSYRFLLQTQYVLITFQTFEVMCRSRSCVGNERLVESLEGVICELRFVQSESHCDDGTFTCVDCCVLGHQTHCFVLQLYSLISLRCLQIIDNFDFQAAILTLILDYLKYLLQNLSYFASLWQSEDADHSIEIITSKKCLAVVQRNSVNY